MFGVFVWVLVVCLGVGVVVWVFGVFVWVCEVLFEYWGIRLGIGVFV